MTTETAVTCEARVGYRAGEYAEMPIWCSAVTALTTWRDLEGRTHHGCRHHVAALLRRHPDAAGPYVSERADDRQAVLVAATELRADLIAADRPPRLERRPSAIASDRCESGGHPGCTCSACF